MTVQELLKKSWSLRRNVVDIIMTGGVSYGALVTSLAWGLNGQVNYMLEGNLNYTGAVITWLKEDVSLIASASESEQRAQQGFPADYMTRNDLCEHAPQLLHTGDGSYRARSTLQWLAESRAASADALKLIEFQNAYSQGKTSNVRFFTIFTPCG